jgi:hypothetical protein
MAYIFPQKYTTFQFPPNFFEWFCQFPPNFLGGFVNIHQIFLGRFCQYPPNLGLTREAKALGF